MSFRPSRRIESTLHYRLLWESYDSRQTQVILLIKEKRKNKIGYVSARQRMCTQSSRPSDLSVTLVLGTFQSDEYENFYRRSLEDLEDVGLNFVKENKQSRVRTSSEKKKKKT